MKVIGIIGAMDIEIKLLKDEIQVLEEKQYAGFKFYVGKYKNLNVVLTSCGVGKVNASSCTQILIDRFNITEIINTGIAGSLNENVRLGDIVISDNVTYHDVRQIQMKNCFPFKEYFPASEELREVAIKAHKNITLENCNYHIGRIVTGEAFISDNDLKHSIISEHNPHCVEMEGAAIGHVAHINNIPFLIIRSISDNADNNATINYAEFEVTASNNSASLVLSMLELINREAYVQ